MTSLRNGSFVAAFSALAFLAGCSGGDGDGTGDWTAPGTGGAAGGGAAGAGGGAAGGAGFAACTPAGVVASSAAQTSAVDSVMFMPGATVSTIAGGAAAGAVDGPAVSASFANPVSIAVIPGGALVVADFDNDLLRRVEPDGSVRTLTKQTTFQRPFGLALSADGRLFVHTDANPMGQKNGGTGTIWRVDLSSGAATVVKSDLGRPRGIAVLGSGLLVLGDYMNARVRLLDPATGNVTDVAGLNGCAGMADGQGANARFGAPYGVVPLPDGRVVVADYRNHRLRVVTGSGQVSTWAGDGGSGTVDGPREQARFAGPKSLAVDGQGNVYVSDDVAHRIRRVGTDGKVTTVAGDGTAGFQDGAGAQAQFHGQEGLAVSPDGSTLYVADGTGGEVAPHHRIRKITLSR